jgi:hypothetical protein
MICSPRGFSGLARFASIAAKRSAYGGETVKSLSTAFLADLEEDWRYHCKEIFPILCAKYPQGYFQGIVSLAPIIRWDVDPIGAFDRPLSP